MFAKRRVGRPPKSGRAVDNPLMSRKLKPIPLGERPGREPYNASEVLLFGLRTPSMDGKPVVLRVKPRKIDGPWTLDNLEILPPLTLALPNGDGEPGIRAMSLGPSTGTSFIILGNSTSQSKAPFKLYTWDGSARGIVRHYQDVRFHRRMKVEG
jgi:hypothetical protein